MSNIKFSRAGALTCWLALFVSGAQGRLQGGTGGGLEGHPGPLPAGVGGDGWGMRGVRGVGRSEK